MMDAKQFAWLYLLKNGYAEGEPSYYGGITYPSDEVREIFNRLIDEGEKSWTIPKKLKDHFINKVKSIGVNWEMTQVPFNQQYSSFEGTDAESGRKEYLVGRLALKDGTSMTWLTDDLPSYNVFEMMENIHKAPAEFEEYFG